jgi:hypothetical protein
LRGRSHATKTSTGSSSVASRCRPEREEALEVDRQRQDADLGRIETAARAALARLRATSRTRGGRRQAQALHLPQHRPVDLIARRREARSPGRLPASSSPVPIQAA